MITKPSSNNLPALTMCALMSENSENMVAIAKSQFRWIVDTVEKSAYSSSTYSGLVNFGLDADLFLGTLHNSILDSIIDFRLSSFNSRAYVSDGAVIGLIGEKELLPIIGNVQNLSLSAQKTGALTVFDQNFVAENTPETESFISRNLKNLVTACSNKAFIEKILSHTSQITEITSAGDTAALVLSTIKNACAAMDLRETSSLFLITDVQTCASLALLSDAAGSLIFPNLSATQGGELVNGIRLIPVGDDQLPEADSNGKYCILFDADGILVNKGALEVGRSNEASLEMSDTPDGTGAVVSLFQTNGTALRVIRTFDALPFRKAMVQISGVNW